jgi:glycosidase
MNKLTLAIMLLVVACTQKTESIESMNASQEQIIRPVVYQMFTRLFGNTNVTNKPWGTLEENGVGKFDDITPAALQSLKNMGITHVWYTGAIEHGVLTDYTKYGIPLDDADVVKGRAGSPYAIKDYYDVNPDLANDVPNRIKEFENLVKRTHDNDMKVLIDFVPNHVARGYISDAKPSAYADFGQDDDTSSIFDPKNNFYYIQDQAFKVPDGYHSLGDHEFPTKDGYFKETPAKATGNDVFSAEPSVNDWFETVKLNYGVDYQNNRTPYFDPMPDTWLKMKDILLYWAAKDIDGFRCDMAEMVPVEFWNWVTAEVKKDYPDIVFIAEIYNPNAYRDYIFTGGFDFLYDKVEMYDTLKHIAQGHASTDDITAIWQRQDGIADNMLRFLENHDEQRIASPDFAGDMNKGIPMMAVSAFMHSGPIMLYFGQDVGEPGKDDSGFAGDDGRTTIFDYWGVPEHVKWVNEGTFDGGQLSVEQKELHQKYVDILSACNKYEAFIKGNFYDLHYFNRNNDYTGYSNNVYVFVRHTKDQVLLVAVNFNVDDENVKIKIPEAAWETFGITGENVEISGNINFAFKRTTTLDYSTNSELEVNLGGLNYGIYKLK